MIYKIFKDFQKNISAENVDFSRFSAGFQNFRKNFKKNFKKVVDKELMP